MASLPLDMQHEILQRDQNLLYQSARLNKTLYQSMKNDRLKHLCSLPITTRELRNFINNNPDNFTFLQSTQKEYMSNLYRRANRDIQQMYLIPELSMSSHKIIDYQIGKYEFDGPISLESGMLISENAEDSFDVFNFNEGVDYNLIEKYQQGEIEFDLLTIKAIIAQRQICIESDPHYLKHYLTQHLSNKYNRLINSGTIFDKLKLFVYLIVNAQLLNVVKIKDNYFIPTDPNDLESTNLPLEIVQSIPILYQIILNNIAQ